MAQGGREAASRTEGGRRERGGGAGRGRRIKGRATAQFLLKIQTVT